MASTALAFPEWMVRLPPVPDETLWRLGREWAGNQGSAPASEVAPATAVFLRAATVDLDPTREGLRLYRARRFLSGVRDEGGSPSVTRLCELPWAALACLLDAAPLGTRAELSRCADTLIGAYDALASLAYVDVVGTASFAATRGGLRPGADDAFDLERVLGTALEGLFAAWTPGFVGTSRQRLERAAAAARAASGDERDERALAYLAWLALHSPRFRDRERPVDESVLRAELAGLAEEARERLALGSIGDGLPLLVMHDRR